MNSDLRNKFIELRVKGDSLGMIAHELGVPKTTLWRWHKEEEAHIHELKLEDQEEFEWEWSTQREDRIAGLNNILGDLHNCMIHKLDEISHHLCLKDLFLYTNLVRSELEQYRLKPLPPQPEGPRSNSKAERNGTAHRPVAKTLTSENHENGHLEQNGTNSFQNGTAVAPESDSLSASAAERCRPLEQSGTDFFQNGTARNSMDLSGDGSSPVPLGDSYRPSRDHVEQNGTISFQNGTVPQPPKEAEAHSPEPGKDQPATAFQNGTEPTPTPQTLSSENPENGHLEQNGTNSFQNGTLVAPASAPFSASVGERERERCRSLERNRTTGSVAHQMGEGGVRPGEGSTSSGEASTTINNQLSAINQPVEQNGTISFQNGTTVAPAFDPLSASAGERARVRCRPLDQNGTAPRSTPPSEPSTEKQPQTLNPPLTQHPQPPLASPIYKSRHDLGNKSSGPNT